MMDTTNCNLCQNDRVSPNGLRKCSCYRFVSRFVAEPIEFLMNFIKSNRQYVRRIIDSDIVCYLQRLVRYIAKIYFRMPGILNNSYKERKFLKLI